MSIYGILSIENMPFLLFLMVKIKENTILAVKAWAGKSEIL